jgi:uncharacterized protein (TIGR03083 family)
MTPREQVPATLPSALRDKVLAAARQARPAGHTVPAVPVISPAETLRRAADALYGLLCVLSEADWRRPVLRDLDVQGLVGHLIGVEEDTHRCLAGDPAVAGADHVESTQPAALRQAGRTPAGTRAEWRRAADHTLRLAGEAGDLNEVMAVHGMRLPAHALLVVRTFEMWTHENDIRRAAGLAASEPDAATLRQMTGLAAGLLPFGAVLTELPGSFTARLVLTGPGGGTWDVPIGAEPPPAAAVGIVTDAVGFCRLVANRISPGDLDLHVSGDSGRAAGVLAAAAALALD